MLIKDQKEAIEVIQKIKLGDRKAQEKFYKHYKQKIEYFLKRKYPNNDEIEDDISEILIKIFEKIDQYDCNKSMFNTWVINVAKNHMIDKLRKNKPLYITDNNDGIDTINYTTSGNFYNENTISLNEYSDIYTFGGTNTSSGIDITSYYCAPDFNLETTSSIKFAASNMSGDDFSMIKMKSSGYNYKEIGLEFNMTEDQVSNKINYAKAKMKKNKEE